MAKTIYQKMAEIQEVLLVPKGQWNEHSKFNYRSCEDILVNLKPLLKEHKMLLILEDEIVNIGPNNYIKASATVFDLEGGQQYTAYGYAREASERKGMDPAQITGATSSYARKYALSGLFAIDNTKDADTDDYSKKELKALIDELNNIDDAKKFSDYVNAHQDFSGFEKLKEEALKIYNEKFKKAAVKQAPAKKEEALQNPSNAAPVQSAEPGATRDAAALELAKNDIKACKTQQEMNAHMLQFKGKLSQADYTELRETAKETFKTLPEK